MRQILIKIHLYFGLVAGALLSVVAITGALYAYEPQLRKAFSEEMEPWEPRTALSPSELSERIRSFGVEGAATAFRWSTDPLIPVWVIWKEADGTRLDFMLDPTTGERLPRAEAARVFFHGVLDIHRTLTLGEAGKKIVGLAAFFLIVLTVSGLFIGVRRWRDVKRVWIPTKSESTNPRPQVRWRFLHRIIGAWATPWLLLMPLTGMVWSFDFYQDLLKRSGGPIQFPDYPKLEEANDSGEVAWDAIWERCLEEVPQQTVMRLMVPKGPDDPMRFEWSPEGTASFAMRSRLFLDPRSAKVVELQAWEDFSPGERLVRWAFPLHTGRIAGVAGQTVAFLGALSLPFFFGSGVYLYVARKRKAKRRRISNHQANEKVEVH